MAASNFGAVAGVGGVNFNWLNRGPQRSVQDNTDVYSGTIVVLGTTPVVDAATMAAYKRDIAIRPIPASSGTGFYADYNGTADPSHTLTLSDGSTLVAVLTKFQRTKWQPTDPQECDVEFTRVV